MRYTVDYYSIEMKILSKTLFFRLFVYAMKNDWRMFGIGVGLSERKIRANSLSFLIEPTSSANVHCTGW